MPVFLKGASKIKASEFEEQISLIAWADVFLKAPNLLFHIPNGGKRNIVEAVKFKKMGVRPGIPDLFLAYGCGGYHGLFIEMKAEKGALTLSQLTLHERLKESGYKVATCHSWLSAADVIREYLPPDFIKSRPKND